jgi:hypothetical protein
MSPAEKWQTKAGFSARGKEAELSIFGHVFWNESAYLRALSVVPDSVSSMSVYTYI